MKAFILGSKFKVTVSKKDLPIEPNIIFKARYKNQTYEVKSIEQADDNYYVFYLSGTTDSNPILSVVFPQTVSDSMSLAEVLS